MSYNVHISYFLEFDPWFVFDKAFPFPISKMGIDEVRSVGHTGG